MDKTKVTDLNLSVRTTNCLMRANIKTVKDLLKVNEDILYSIRGMGKGSVKEVLSYIEKYLNQNTKNKSVPNAINYLVVNRAFPEKVWNSRTRILFKTSDGLLVEDLEIEKLNLSNRTLSGLKTAGIKTINEVAFMPVDKLKRLKKLGNKSIGEIIGTIQNIAVVDGDSIAASKQVNDIYRILKKHIKNNDSKFNINSFETPIKQCITKHPLEIKYKNKSDLEDCLYNEEYFNKVLTDDIFINSLMPYVLQLICKNDKPVSKRELEDKLPKLFSELDLINKCIRNLSKEKHIEHVNGGYQRRLPTINEWAETLPDKIRDMLKMRLNGKTLEECAKPYGITRERARQLIARTLNNQRPLLKEDLYRYWFDKYYFTAQQFASVFDVEQSTFYYLDLISKRGNDSIDNIFDDLKADKKIRSNLEKELRKTRIYLNGKYLPKKRNIIINEFGRNICSEKSISLDEFYNEYLRFLSQINKTNDEELSYANQRSFEANVSLYPNYLFQYGRKVRFYPISEYDMAEFYSKIDFKQYKNTEISTLRIFNDYKDLMDEYDIENEYELHNLLKKNEDEWNKNNKYKVDITRMPFISFGKANREKQTIDLLFQLAPISFEDFAKAYEDEYGILARTVMANFHQYIAKYYHDGVYSVDQNPLQKDEKQFLLDYLTNDFYFVEDVTNAFAEKFGEDKASHVNSRSLYELGYKTYTKCILRNKYQSLEEYFYLILTESDSIDLNMFNQRMMYNNSFFKVLNDLRNNYDLLEYEDKKYISFSRFSNVLQDTTKDDLIKYVKDVIEYAKDFEYFTIDFLKGKGFNHSFHNIPLGNWFFSSIIKYSRLVKTIDYAKNRLFYNDAKKRTAANFLEKLVEELHDIDIDKLQNILNNSYGLYPSKDRLILLIKGTDLYYDNIMNKVYFNKEYYYDDIR